MRAKEAQNAGCQSQLSNAFGTVLKSISSQLSSSAGTISKNISNALSQTLPEIFSKANITKCLNCTSQKIEDDLDGDQSDCGGNKKKKKKTSAPSKDTKRKITVPGKEKSSKDKNDSSDDKKSPDDQNGSDEESFLDYPSKFDKSKSYSPPKGHTDALRKRWSLRSQQKDTVKNHWSHK